MVPREEINLSRPLYVMLKPVGARCNLACDYCYYLSKQKLYDTSSRHLMSEQLLERFTQEYIEAQTTDEVLFTWHGGEPLLRPLSFYRRALELQRKYANGKIISNALQTNGTLITEEWARFLHENQWLVGVSIDGPQDFHDRYRRTPSNQPSWAKVRKGIDLLNRFHVEWNAMAVVNALNGDHPLEFYRFFRDELQCRFLQFTPIVDGNNLKTSEPQNLKTLHPSPFTLHPSSVTFVPFSMNGCRTEMWAKCLSNSLMPPLPTGVASRQVCARWPVRVVMLPSWSGMAMSMPATILSFLSINSATSTNNILWR